MITVNCKLFRKAILYCILATAASAIITSPLRKLLNSILLSEQSGPPCVSFLITVGAISLIMKLLFAIAYILMGQKLPIKNTYLKPIVFCVLFLISDYLPQILGITGGDGPIIKAAVDIPIIICDLIGFMIGGVLLGFLFKETGYHAAKACKKFSLLKTAAISAVLFPCMVITFDQILGHIYSPLYCYNVMKVSQSKITTFDLIFYSCFIVTGALLPVFYRFTEYNDSRMYDSIRFGAIYALCLWTPVVAIMVAFGADVIITIFYSVIFIFCIMLISMINGKLLKIFNS